MVELKEIIQQVYNSYSKETSTQIKVIDLFLVYIMMTGIIQFIYLILVGQFPFNAFLSGFISAVGCFVLTVSLRLQITNPSVFHNISLQRAYADYVVCNIILHFVVATFMG